MSLIKKRLPYLLIGLLIGTALSVLLIQAKRQRLLNQTTPAPTQSGEKKQD